MLKFEIIKIEIKFLSIIKVNLEKILFKYKVEKYI